MLTSGFYKVLSLAWFLGILYLCSVNPSKLPSINFTFFEIDKLVHIILFGVQAYLIVFSFKLPNRSVYLLAFLLSVGYGVIIEIVQGLFLPLRSFDYADMLADLIGAIVFTLLAIVKNKYTNQIT